MYWKGKCDMAKLINERTNEVILEDLRIAETFFKRFRGLMGVKSIPQNSGLMIKPCNSVHCFFMNFSIDVVFLDKEDRIIDIMENMEPRNISPIIWDANYVIEANALKFTGNIRIGDKVKVL